MKAWNNNTNYIIRIIVPWLKEQWSAPFLQRPVQSLLQAKQQQKSKFLRGYSIELQKFISKTFSSKGKLAGSFAVRLI